MEADAWPNTSLTQPLRFEVAPGTIAAHQGQTVVILESTVGSEVRVRDIASGMELDVPVSDLNGITVSLSRKDIQNRWERVRSSTRDEWLRARRRERLIRRLIRDDGATAKRVRAAGHALGLSRTSIYRLLQRYRQAAQTSSLLIGHRGGPLIFASKSNGMDAPAFNGISCAKVEVSSNHLIQQERPQ